MEVSFHVTTYGHIIDHVLSYVYILYILYMQLYTDIIISYHIISCYISRTYLWLQIFHTNRSPRIQQPRNNWISCGGVVDRLGMEGAGKPNPNPTITLKSIGTQAVKFLRNGTLTRWHEKNSMETSILQCCKQDRMHVSSIDKYSQLDWVLAYHGQPKNTSKYSGLLCPVFLVHMDGSMAIAR